MYKNVNNHYGPITAFYGGQLLLLIYNFKNPLDTSHTCEIGLLHNPKTTMKLLRWLADVVAECTGFAPGVVIVN